MKIWVLTSLLFCLLTISVICKNSQPGNETKVTAIKLNEIINVDGILSEQIWGNAPVISNFTQRDPEEGKSATEKTEVRLAYDESYLYVGARIYDSSPDSIVARMSRRDDGVNSDGLTIFLDPYNDNRSGYYFAISASGTLFDGVLYNDDWNDNSWDAVWEAKANIDEHGWTAEMQIPFSQLKFHQSDEMVWGINIKRELARKNEVDYLVYWPKNESGFVSHFAELTGLENIQAPKKLELMPYVTARAEYTHPDINDPFRDGSRYVPDIGADLKMGIGSSFTLNATVNPDFGQVEIDPAVINLSDVETYFTEKRPFFTEGSKIFEFGLGGARSYWGFNWPGPNFFYSRRLGRAPQGSIPDADFTDSPSGTHILGAAKLTGKIGDSWNVGTIQALTSSEEAEYQYEGKRNRVEVEPFTYYGILRVQKEFNDARHGLGFISTAATRNFSNTNLTEDINKSAFSFGIDGWTFLDSSKTWVIAGWTGASAIQGTKDRITALQENSQHYFQRPDSKVNRLDTSATSLSGYAARVYLNKQKGNFFFNSALGVISPGFDVNDVGFLYRADLINMHIGGGYYWEQPTDFYRYVELVGAVFRSYDFDGNIVWEGVFGTGYYQFLNYYWINWDAAYNPATINNRRTRGGPLTLNYPGYQIGFNAGSDRKKDIVFEVGYFTYKTPDHSYEWQVNSEIEFRPASNISLSISPFFSKVFEVYQWVNAFDDPSATATYGKRYVFAELDQNTFGAGIRLNWTFSPKLSLQLFAQPLISSGAYNNYKELQRPLSHDYLVYGTNGSSFDQENLVADPDGTGPVKAMEIDKPDFSYKSLRGNAVLRWEYLPGSVVYLVWTQTRQDFGDIGEFQFKNSMRRLWDAQPDNIFMIKFNYWLNM